MARYEDYIIQQPRQDLPKAEIMNDVWHRFLFMDETVKHGAPYVEVVWYNKPYDLGPNSHYHSFDEFLGFMGSYPENPSELYARVRLNIDGEDIWIDKSSLVYIPAGVPHSIFAIEELERPILHFSGGPNAVCKREGDNLVAGEEHKAIVSPL